MPRQIFPIGFERISSGACEGSNNTYKAHRPNKKMMSHIHRLGVLFILLRIVSRGRISHAAEIGRQRPLCSLQGIIYPTGVSETGNSAAIPGTKEQHWSVYRPTLSGIRPLETDPVVFAQEDVESWLPLKGLEQQDTTGQSQWISVGSSSSILYRFDQKFDLPDYADLDTINIEGRFAANYSVLAVHLNGFPIFVPDDPITSYTPGGLAGSFRLSSLSKTKNTLSFIVISPPFRDERKRAWLKVWFPKATFLSKGTTCGDSERIQRHLLHEEEEILAQPSSTGIESGLVLRKTRGLFSHMGVHLRNPSFKVLSGEEEEEAPTRTLQVDKQQQQQQQRCPLMDVSGTSDEDKWQTWYRTYDESDRQGPWSTNEAADTGGGGKKGWITPASPASTTTTTTSTRPSDWIVFYQTNFTIPAGTDLQSVVISGQYASDFNVLSVWLNSQPIWSNSDPFFGPRTTAEKFEISKNQFSEDPSSLVWQYGRNSLEFAVLANPDNKAAGTSLQLTFTSATYGGCSAKIDARPMPKKDEILSMAAPLYNRQQQQDNNNKNQEEDSASSSFSLPCSAGCRPLESFALNASSKVRSLAIDATQQMLYVLDNNKQRTPPRLSRYSLKDYTELVPLRLEANTANISSIAIGPSGEIYVLEKRRLTAYSTSDGSLLGRWGPLTAAQELAVLPVSTNETWVYVIDSKTAIKGFQTFPFDNGQGPLLAPVTSFNLCSSKFCLTQATDLAISFNVSETADSEAPVPTIWVLDQQTPSVALFTIKGALLDVISASKAFVEPSKIHVDFYRGLAYVLDVAQQSVSVFDRRRNLWYRMDNDATTDECHYFSRQSLFTSTSLLQTEVQQFPKGAEVGIKIATFRPGFLTAIRFFKSSDEVGPHVATIWSPPPSVGEGSNMTTTSSATTASNRRKPLMHVYIPEPDDPTASGWITVDLPTPLTLQASTEYLISMGINKWAVGLNVAPSLSSFQTEPGGMLYSGKDLLGGGGYLSKTRGKLPQDPTFFYFMDVEVSTTKPTLNNPTAGALSTAYVVNQERAYYVYNAQDNQVVKMQCSGYPKFMGDCGHHLQNLDESVTTGLRSQLSGQKVIGVNFWGGRYSLNSQVNYLTEGARLVKEANAESIGVYMGGEALPSEIYPFNPSDSATSSSSYTSLTELANSSDYRALFEDPDISTYVINANAFATVGLGMKLRYNAYSTADAQKETEEFRNFTKYLATTYKNTGKTFILQAWSLDSMLADSNMTGIPWSWASQASTWLKARQAGVEMGRVEVGEKPSSVAIYHSVQLNRGVLAKSRGELTSWAIDRILPNITVDLIGWGAYEASRKTDSRYLTAGIQTLQKLMSSSSSRSYGLEGLHYPNPRKDKPPVYLAEIGEPDMRLNGDPESSKVLLPKTIKAAVEQNIPLILYWGGYNTEVIYTADARPWPETHVGYWLKRPDGTSSFAMCYIQALQSFPR